MPVRLGEEQCQCDAALALCHPEERKPKDPLPSPPAPLPQAGEGSRLPTDPTTVSPARRTGNARIEALASATPGLDMAWDACWRTNIRYRLRRPKGTCLRQSRTPSFPPMIARTGIDGREGSNPCSALATSHLGHQVVDACYSSCQCCFARSVRIYERITCTHFSSVHWQSPAFHIAVWARPATARA